jgi:predicted kinase
MPTNRLARRVHAWQAWAMDEDMPPIPAVPSPMPGAVQPVVIALIGLPGAGKTIVARALEDQLKLRRLCRDTIRQAMFPRCSYTFAEKRAAFRALLLGLEINCLLTESSVIDGMTFSRRRDLERVDEVVRRYSHIPLPVFLDCPPQIARERVARDLATNQHLARDRTAEVVNEVLARFDPPPPSALVINATLPPAEVCRQVVDAVASIMGLEPLRRAGND